MRMLSADNDVLCDLDFCEYLTFVSTKRRSLHHQQEAQQQRQQIMTFLSARRRPFHQHAAPTISPEDDFSKCEKTLFASALMPRSMRFPKVLSIMQHSTTRQLF